jgi:recombination protein RecT
MNAAVENAVVERQQPKDFPAMLTAWLPEIQRALPKHLSAERMARIALTAFRRTPKLGQCDPRSVFAAVIQSSQLGLEVDTLGRAYLVPYKKNKKTAKGWESTMECQFIPGWKGLVDLMNRSGQGSVWTGAVFEGDEFLWELGDSPRARHHPMGENDPKKLTHVYAVGRVKGSDWPIIEVWPIAKVWKHRDRYNKVGEDHYSFENPEMYARKIPLLQVLKYMPCSVELAQAIALSDAAEIGGQNLTIKNVIDGTWDADHAEEAPAQEKTRSATVREAVAASRRTEAGVDTETGEIERKEAPPITLQTVLDYIAKATTEDQADIALDLGQGKLDKDEWAKAATARNERVAKLEQGGQR